MTVDELNEKISSNKPNARYRLENLSTSDVFTSFRYLPTDGITMICAIKLTYG